MAKPIRMSRRRWVAAWTVLCAAGLAAATGFLAKPEPRPAPPPVYSSCLAADTKPVPADDDRCDGR
ncbi:hypothetical protein [Streptomyces sp. NPDC051214]|uniref:hypothetical protein n=1 Tax=Streptomyces sp. NPDC051214 TaxID=3155282 RepID=UPI00343A2C45